MTPFVSVLVPCYNEAPERIAATVKSAQRALADEIIIIDDGSASPPIVPIGPGVYVYRQEHAGISAAMNHATRRATGDYVCWLACGDTMHRDKIVLQLDTMRAWGALASFTHYEDERGDYDLSRLSTDNQFCGSTAMVHRDVALEFPFDEQLMYCSDWDVACRIQYDGPGWLEVPAILGACYEHPGGHTDRARHDDRMRVRRMQDRATVVRRWRGR